MIGLVLSWSGLAGGVLLLGYGAWLERRRTRPAQDQSIENP